MEVLVAVVDDLWLFLRESLFGAVRSRQDTPLLAAPVKNTETVSREEVVSPEVVTDGDAVQMSEDVSDEAASYMRSPALLHTGEQYYIGAVGALVHADPVIAFDNALEELEYGQSVRLLQLQGRWAQVRYGEMVGWVLKDALCAALSDVFPQFEDGESYIQEHEGTRQLRAFIGDIFGGARSDYPLTAEEYVYYKLLRGRRVIQWGDERSRIAGTWQRRLKGRQGIYIRITPKTDAVMEYVVDDIGYLAYVDAVYPDNSIKISQIVTEDNSRFFERTLEAEEWRELRPVFITVA